MSEEFVPVIGLEVHCQLATDSKIFCSCKARLNESESVSEEAVNRNTCPICAGHPGTLPVLNKKVVEYAIQAGLATHCEIKKHSVFSRKNYFYPDLPKGYQISQYDRPICENGYLEIELKNNKNKRVRIQRIHIEEDAGKNVHFAGYSLVNLNRACVPLVEIVSAPDIQSAEEAGAYLRNLHAIVTFLGICDGNMQEGNFRCDANVSIMPKGSQTFGTRVEIKNVNSFRFVEKAIEYEIIRQAEVIRSGKKVVQETRTYDSAKNVTISMRSKEEAQDYRYFPEPDLLPLKLDDAWISSIKSKLPELPHDRKNRFINSFGLSSYDAGVLTGSKTVSEFFMTALSGLDNQGLKQADFVKPLSNFITGEILRLINDAGIELSRSQIKPSHLIDLVPLYLKNEISSTAAKTVLGIAFQSGEKIQTILDREGLKQVSDRSTIESTIEQILKEHPEQVAQFRSGKDKLMGFFVGKVMKAMQGKANPELTQEILKSKLSG